MPAANTSVVDDVHVTAKFVHNGGRPADAAGFVVLLDDHHDDTEHGYFGGHDVELDNDIAFEPQLELAVDVLVQHDDVAIGRHVVVFSDDLFDAEVARRS